MGSSSHSSSTSTCPGDPRGMGRADPYDTEAGNGHGLVEPFIVKYYGQGEAAPIRIPLLPLRPRTGSALIEGFAGLDITFRMLQPHELAAAQGFPAGYRFSGGKQDQVKQIENRGPGGDCVLVTLPALRKRRGVRGGPARSRSSRAPSPPPPSSRPRSSRRPHASARRARGARSPAARQRPASRPPPPSATPLSAGQLAVANVPRRLIDLDLGRRSDGSLKRTSGHRGRVALAGFAPAVVEGFGLQRAQERPRRPVPR